ncbi:thermonuclease family protein [Bacillus sp. FJAT-49705]|uniref:Thermonuclease family protein n=1 Tax=Cytobacillus citreus TaxID=2833586 RepID=A0ABS5NP86_9BACI|nr:thermonuclease family protein [Cytobacillus citreus]
MIIFVFTIFSFFILPTLTAAHNGARDELGGHFRKADCVYLLHEPSSIAKTAANMEELIQLIKKYNSNSSCASGLSKEKVDLEGYSFPNQSKTDQTEVLPPSVDMSSTEGPNEAIKLGMRYPAELVKCIDGDTAHFKINGQTYKTRFLYIDTPESTNKIEPFGKEASTYTCSYLRSGNITLETDGDRVFDKYNRLLAWVWVDDQLLQEEITKAGLVEDFYDYGNYLYEDRIVSAMAEAKKLSKGMYAPSDEEKNDIENKSVAIPDKTEETSTDNTQTEKIDNNQKDESSKAKEKKNEENGISDKVIIGLLVIVFLYIFIKRKNRK